MSTFEVTRSRRSVVSDTLAGLAEETRQWREKIDLLEAGQQLDRTETIAALERLLDACQNVRDAILSEDSAARWESKDELHALVARLDQAAAKRQRYLDLAQWLAAGTVSHKRERTRQERLRQRDAAVAELMEISALAAPPDLPGPAVDEWLEWACNLDDSTGDPDLKQLNASFPRVDDFVRQLELDHWHSGSERQSGDEAATRRVASGSLAAAASNGNGNGHSNGLHIHEVDTDPRGPSAYDDAAIEAEAGSAIVCAAREAPVTEAGDETASQSAALPAAEAGKISFFAPDEVDLFHLSLNKAAKDRDARKVRALVAASHWLLPRDHNPVMQARCGIRAQLGYMGTSDLANVTPHEAEKAIAVEESLPLLTGGADLLRWALSHEGEERFEAIASVRRFTPAQIKAWFTGLYKIELADPQVEDMYRLTFGIPLLMGELHRRVIPMPEAPPTWLGFAIWTRVKSNFEERMPALARELKSGPPAVRLTEREIAVLKMVAIASDDSTPDTIAANLMENWHKYHHPEHQALSSADEPTVKLLERLGLLPMRSESGLRPIKALVPVEEDDPIREIVKNL